MSYISPKCPVCSSALKPACINGCTTSELLHCTRCPTTQLLCGSCLYPCTSAGCTNKLCPLISTLLICEVVSDPKSKVHGCPMFRACPKCHNLIKHEKGCKFVTCASCFYSFCFICLQDNCSKDAANYWSLTCTKQRAERQRFLSPQSWTEIHPRVGNSSKMQIQEFSVVIQKWTITELLSKTDSGYKRNII